MSNNPNNYIGRVTKLGRDLRYPSNIGSVEDGLHHFMIIKEMIYDEEKKNDDPLNGQTKFEQIVGSRNDNSFYKEGRTFILFLPQGGLTTQYSAKYDSVDVGFFGRLVENNLGSMIDQLGSAFDDYQLDRQSGGGMLESTFNFYDKAIGAFANSNAARTAEEFVTSNRMIDQMKFNVASAIGGIATLGNDKVRGEDVAALSMRAQRNPYTSLVFVGNTTKRTHNFKFQFSPKSSPESEAVQQIIANLKQGMLPSLPKLNPRVDSFTVMEDNPAYDELNPADKAISTQMGIPKQIPKTYRTSNNMDSNLFKFPNVYTINFFDSNSTELDSNKHLYKIGQSVLTSLKVDYAETFFQKTGLPTQINLNLEFKENFTLSRTHIEEGY